MNKNFIAVFSEIGKGGAEKVVASLGNHLINEDYRVTIISLGPQHDYGFLGFSEKIEIVHFPRKGKFDFSSFPSVRDILEERKASFVFCVDFFSHVFISILRLRYHLTFKSVLNIHSMFMMKKKDYMLIFIASKFLRRNDWVVFISKNQQKFLTSYFLLNANCNKTIIYNGINTEALRIATPEDKRALRHSLLNIDNESDKVIIKVAGIRVEKNYEVAIRALKYFHDTFKYKPYFVILGDGKPELTNPLKKLVDDLNLNEYVKFIGFNTNVNDFLSSSDLFTLTSESETFSLAALEAMACGLPVVLTHVGGADEMIQEDVNGYLSIIKDPADIANKWHKALQKNFDQQQIREFVVNNYDEETMNSNYFDFFNAI